MYASYHHKRGFSPTGFSAALAVNAGLIAMIVYAAPNIAPPERITRLDATNIPIPKPPPPEPVERKTEAVAERQVQHRIVAPDPIVERLADPVFDAPPYDPADLPPLAPPGNANLGGGTGERAAPPPAPPPLVQAEIDPRYSGQFQPDYPASEIRRQNEGRVVVRVRIGTDGRVKAVERVSAASDAFFRATERQALSRWRFRPATRGGTAEESWKTMTVRFTLENGR